MAQQQRIDRLPIPVHTTPVIGGKHLKPGELAGPGRRYSNLPGTCAAVVKAPTVEAAVDGSTPLVVLTLPETVLLAVARAVHLGAGADGARTFGRAATGDRDALRRLLGEPAVREALTLTISAGDARELGDHLSDADLDLDDMLAAAGADPDEARDLRIDDDLLDAGERPAL